MSRCLRAGASAVLPHEIKTYKGTCEAHVFSTPFWSPDNKKELFSRVWQPTWDHLCARQWILNGGAEIFAEPFIIIIAMSVHHTATPE